MKKTFPSFDLGIDHLFPSEPEERKKKKEEKSALHASMLVSLTTSSRELKQGQKNKLKYATKYAVNVVQGNFCINHYNKILKITFCSFFKKCNIKLNANYMLQTANILKSNFTRPIGCRVLAVKCSKNDH